MTPLSVVVLTPSRGLIHSRTVEAVHTAVACAVASRAVRLIDPVNWWLVTHDLPIPDCHETLAAHGLATGADALWFVEEDMLPPLDALELLTARQHQTGAGIVTMDYPVGEPPQTQSCVTHDNAGAVWWAGLGCTLITRQAFAALERPWFRTGYTYLWRDGALTISPSPARYGGQDVTFYLAAHEAGVGIAEIAPDAAIAGHARLRTLGTSQVNAGTHTIAVLRDIKEWR